MEFKSHWFTETVAPSHIPDNKTWNEIRWLLICEPANNFRPQAVKVISVLCQLIFLLVCSLMLPLPAHPDTAADILCQKWKIVPAGDGKIRNDCHDMHVVFWVEIRGAILLKEFLLSAFIELSSEQRLNSPAALESDKEIVFYASTFVAHIVRHHWNQHASHANNRTIFHIHCIRKRKQSVLGNQNVVTKQNSNWDGCRGPFQTCFASGTVCQLHFISVPPTEDAG